MRALVFVTVALVAGCAEAPGSYPAADAGNDLQLYVSNQSFDQPSADILVLVDGRVAFDGEANVEGQHNWMLREIGLAPGPHVVKASERDSGAKKEMAFDLPAGEQRWIVVDYWYTKGAGAEPGFTISVHDESPAFG